MKLLGFCSVVLGVVLVGLGAFYLGQWKDEQDEQVVRERTERCIELARLFDYQPVGTTVVGETGGWASREIYACWARSPNGIVNLWQK